VKSPPDGYTLLLASTTNTINATLYDKLNFNFIRDIAPVATISRNTHVMAVHPSMPAKTVPEFIAYSKANPGKINMASAGSGSTSHVSGELFKMMTGVNLVHVPYRGAGPALVDLLAGVVQVMTAGPSLTQSGHLALCVGDLPTKREYALRADAEKPQHNTTANSQLGPG